MVSKEAIVIGVICIFVLGMIIVGVVVYEKHRENYGGPIKGVRHIPLNTGQSICRGYFKDCVERGDDSDICYQNYAMCNEELTKTPLVRI
jgi:hypothetical protein